MMSPEYPEARHETSVETGRPDVGRGLAGRGAGTERSGRLVSHAEQTGVSCLLVTGRQAAE